MKKVFLPAVLILIVLFSGCIQSIEPYKFGWGEWPEMECEIIEIPDNFELECSSIERRDKFVVTNSESLPLDDFEFVKSPAMENPLSDEIYWLNTQKWSRIEGEENAYVMWRPSFYLEYGTYELKINDEYIIAFEVIR